MQHADGVVDALQVTHARAPTGLRQQVGATAHGFGASGQGHISVTQQKGLGGRDDGLQARAAQTIDVEGWGFLGHARVHRGDAAQVGIARLGRDHGTHDHMADIAGGDARALDGGAGDGAGQVCQWQV